MYEKARLIDRFCRGLSGILCVRRPLSSLTDESLAEDSGELGLGLEPFARRSASLTPHEGDPRGRSSGSRRRR